MRHLVFKTLFFIFIVVLNIFCLAQTTNISGVLNAYTNVTVINSATLTVGNSVSFAVGDRVMLIQMKGATIDLTNTSNYGTVSSLNNAGNFEFATVSLIPNGTTIVLSTTLSNSYSAGGTNRVQLVRVRSISGNANVNGNISATAWNGTTGGVIALEVSHTLTIASGFRIDASGQGFRGGAVSLTSDGTAWCNWSDFRSSNITVDCYDGIYAQKGEGIAEDAGNDYGRGPLANGGGGSGEHNGGGGGGSNVSYGGDGGMQFSGCPYRRNNTGLNCNTPAGGAAQVSICTPSAVNTTTNVMVGGLGGKALTAGSSNNKIFMGGGGGGGQQNGAGGTSGANGGGIIVISATTIVNNSGFADAIRANGNNAGNTTGNEGAGGGGGGGSILLETNTFANAITLSTRGGNGGNAVTSNAQCRGPGGGGGGGLIWINGLTSTPVNLTTNVLSGNSGSVTCSSAANCGGVPPASNTLTCYGNILYCAVTPTSNGTVFTSLNLPLPIELLSFYSECSANKAVVHWSVSKEDNIKQYSIERSIDAQTWVTVNSLFPSTDPSFPKTYSVTDDLFNKNTIVYYRLKYIENNGRVYYSSLITSRCKNRADLEYSVSYNDGFIFDFGTLPLKVRVYSALGQLISELHFDNNSSNVYYLQLNQPISDGIYIISCEFPDQIISKKLQIIR